VVLVGLDQGVQDPAEVADGVEMANKVNSQANAAAVTGNVGIATANDGGVTPMPGTTGVSGSNSTGATASTGGMNASGDINTATASNNAGSVNAQAQTPAGNMAAKSQANAHAAENQTNR